MDDGKNFGIRLEDGAILPIEVEKLADKHGLTFCDVIGFGELDWVELAMDDHATIVQRFEGPLQLIALNGRLRMAGAVTLCDFYCSFSRQTDNGIQVLGGKLHSASAVFVELTLSPLASLEAEINAIDPRPAVSREVPTRELTRSPSIAPPSFAAPQSPRPNNRVEAVASPAPSTVVSAPRDVNQAPAALDDRWAKAVMESNRLHDDPTFADDEESDRRPKRGDIVQHAQFGECQVSRIDDDHITLRKPDGRNVQLGLTVLRFVPLGKQKGKNAFRVQIGKR